ncbi:MAG: metallophosphoesterase family protein [Candidatus Marithrix sp.]
MKTAIFSDIHGNLSALETVLDNIKEQNVDRILCLGDLVEGGDHNDAVVDIIRKNDYQTVIGNHDEINDCILTQSNQEWLSNLPENIIEKNILFTHVSPRRKKRLIISSDIEAWNVFDEENFRLCFIGHTHSPVIYGDKNNSFGEAKTYDMDEGIFCMKNNDRYIISFGAVGYPRNGGIYIRYGIFDDQENTVEFIKLNGFLLPYGSNTQY